MADFDPSFLPFRLLSASALHIMSNRRSSNSHYPGPQAHTVARPLQPSPPSYPFPPKSTFPVPHAQLQVKAIDTTLGRRLTLWQGPPGTGKTTTLLRCVGAKALTCVGAEV